jgi:hypothetical protein
MRCSPQSQWRLLANNPLSPESASTQRFVFGRAVTTVRNFQPFSAANLSKKLHASFLGWKTKIAFHLYSQALVAFCMICRRPKMFLIPGALPISDLN